MNQFFFTDQIQMFAFAELKYQAIIFLLNLYPHLSITNVGPKNTCERSRLNVTVFWCIQNMELNLPQQKGKCQKTGEKKPIRYYLYSIYPIFTFKTYNNPHLVVYVIQKYLVDSCTQNNISCDQHAFNKNVFVLLSCQLLLECLQDWTTHKKPNMRVDLTYIELSNAFDHVDSLPGKYLLLILQKLGITGKIV